MIKNWLKYTIFGGLFLIPFVPFFVSSHLFFPFITSKGFAWRIIVETVFFAWIALALMDQAYRPKKSPLVYALAAFLVIVGVADALGVAPVKSFWSNAERMEGFITLLHLGMIFLVSGSVLSEIEWRRWWNTSLAASFIMSIYCLFQLAGSLQIHQGGVRVDGTLGNAAYLAVYILFHIFVSIWFLYKERNDTAKKWLYGLLALLLTFILYHTATRGAILGLIGGLGLIALLNLGNKEDKGVRRVSQAGLLAVIILVGGFFALRNSSFVTSSPVLSRFATISSEEIKSGGRAFIWPMAIKGFLDKPVLGWGQDNFNYIFNQYYNPAMYNLEPWFDRAHNIFLDWLVAAGSLGLLAYLSLYGALLYLLWKDKGYSYVEKTIITGLVAAYFFHNLFVFDNLISYILFFSLLAHIYSRSEKGMLWQRTFSFETVRNVVLPGAAVVLVLTLYFVNYKPLRANINLIHALEHQGTVDEIKYFKAAYNGSRLGRPEVVEQLAVNGPGLLSSQIPMEDKNDFFQFARTAIENQAKELSTDARYQIMAGSFLAATGYADDGLVYLERAKTLMPEKQMSYFETGNAYLVKGDSRAALNEFRQAYELAPESINSKLIYLLGAIYAGDGQVEAQMKKEIDEKTVIFDDRVLSAYYRAGRTSDVVAILNRRIELDPVNAETYRNYLQQVQKK